MKIFVLLLIVLCGLLGSYITRAGWTEWRTLIMCNAKPCPCEGYDDRCQHGKEVQTRMCKIDPNNSADNCDFDDEGGYFRRIKCWNGRETCPGWSDWEYPEDECHRLDEDNNNSRCIIIPKRYCNNPPPIYEDIICFSEIELEHQMTEKSLYDERNCICPVEPEVQYYEPIVYNEYDDYGKNAYDYSDYEFVDYYDDDDDDDNKDENNEDHVNEYDDYGVDEAVENDDRDYDSYY